MRKSKNRSFRIVLRVALFAIPALLFLFPIFFPWTGMNSTHDDIDIATGRLRHTRYLFFCKVSERIEETGISRARSTRKFPATSEPEWRRVNTLSFGTPNSPHHIFHGAITQVAMFEAYSQRAAVADPANEGALRQRAADGILSRWQSGESDDAAREYLQELWDSLHEY